MYSTGEGRAKQGYVFSIKMDHEETGCGAVEWIQLA
jgi:hypothetical protein